MGLIAASLVNVLLVKVYVCGSTAIPDLSSVFLTDAFCSVMFSQISSETCENRWILTENELLKDWFYLLIR